MKAYSLARFYLLLGSLCLFNILTVNAQSESLVNYYLSTTADYAEIYNGQIEVDYNLRLYVNTPYFENQNLKENEIFVTENKGQRNRLDLYKEQLTLLSRNNSDFTEGDFIYKGIHYPKQQVRLDLYKEQLVLLTPEKRYGVIVDPQYIQDIKLQNSTFLWINPPSTSNLKNGYYRILYRNNQLQLLAKERYVLRKKDILLRFEHQITYYGKYNDIYHEIKNKNSFIKIFPQYKNQINKFVKDNKLNFKNDKEQSMILVMEYCEELITSNI